MFGRSGVRQFVVLAVAAMVVASCGGAAGEVARRPSGDSGSVSARVAFEGDLLAGVPDDCRLVEAVGAPDDPSADVEAFGGVVVSGLDAGVDRGPLVAVDAGDGSGTTVVAAVLFDGDTAVWVVEPEAGPEVTSANRAAATASSFPLEAVDTAGDDPVAYAMASATDCSEAAAAPFRPVEPEPAPSMRPDLLVLAPDPAAPGDTVAMRFPEESGRGVAFQLDQQIGGEWFTRYWLTSDGNGGRPISVPVYTEGYGVPDVGVGGPGPDHIVLPDDVVAGSYRICTANAGDEFCASVEISDED